MSKKDCPHRQSVEGGIPLCEKRQAACYGCKESILTDAECADILEHPTRQSMYVTNKLETACQRAATILHKFANDELREVVNAKWYFTTDIDTQEDIYKCSHCGRIVRRNIESYCPSCGAQMDGGTELDKKRYSRFAV